MRENRFGWPGKVHARSVDATDPTNSDSVWIEMLGKLQCLLPLCPLW
jgi:hypothetical protein